jgi:pimeloyl-ACP methyl ester carboxylesterase
VERTRIDDRAGSSPASITSLLGSPLSTEMSVQRSTVVLVHGGWRGSWCWAEVVPLLHRQGLCVRTIDLPSIDADPDDGSALSGDAAAVTALLDDTQEPALLCGHS